VFQESTALLEKGETMARKALLDLTAMEADRAPLDCQANLGLMV